jgi:hypothetical protein
MMATSCISGLTSRCTPVFKRRVQAAVLVCVMLFAALAPGISHALARVQGQAPVLMEVCTTQGMRVIAIAPSASPSQEQVPAVVHLEHCKFCASGVVGAPPPFEPVLPVLSNAVTRAEPERFLSAPRTPHIWRTGPARAPPSL